MNKRIVSFALAIIFVFVCACQKDNKTANGSNQNGTSSNQDIISNCFPSPPSDAEQCAEATHIMIAFNLGAQRNGENAEFIFVPLDSIKGELQGPVPIAQIVVKGKLSDYDFTDTYTEGNFYLLFLEYDEENECYHDKKIIDSVIHLDPLDLDVPAQWESIVDNLYKNNHHRFKWLEELMQESNKLLDSSDSTTAE